MRLLASSVRAALAGLTLFLASLVPVVAQGGAGVIEGRVANAATGSFLEGVRLSVEGTTLEAATDSDGNYRLVGVPAGAVRVRAFYTGMVVQTTAVQVTAGGLATADFRLGATAAAGDRFDHDREADLLGQL